MPFSLSLERANKAEEIIGRYPVKRAACIPLLQLCQEQEGWASPDVMVFVGQRLEMDLSAVKGVVTFYTMFHQEPVAPNVVWVCRTLSCELRGARAVQEHLENRFGCKAGGTSRDGKFTLLRAECLAACGQAPMIQLNDTYHENLTLEKLDQIVDERAKRTVVKGTVVKGTVVKGPAQHHVVGERAAEERA